MPRRGPVPVVNLPLHPGRPLTVRTLLTTALALAVALPLLACHGPYLSDRLGDTQMNSSARPVIRSSRKQSRTSRRPRGSNGQRASARRPSTPPPRGAGGYVKLTPGDLQPVRAWIHHRNAQWILGDNVDVVVSKEFFSQVLTLNQYSGIVHRTDKKYGDDLVVTLTYRGSAEAACAKTNPRVLIGTGLTVTARKRLRLRLAKTKSRRQPVRLYVSATGNAVRGRGEDVDTRDENALSIQGALRWNGSRWVWNAG